MAGTRKTVKANFLPKRLAIAAAILASIVALKSQTKLSEDCRRIDTLIGECQRRLNHTIV